MRNPCTAVLGLTLAFMTLGVVAPAVAEETDNQQLVVSIERIWDRPAHSAFTDLIQFKGALYCTFREGTGHIPGLNGTIRVIRSRDGMNWESVALLDEPHVDLRDPKLSVTPDGRLMLSTGASYYHGTKRLRIESRVAFSDSAGERFGPPQKVVLPESIVTGFDWLWRVTWHEGWSWGCVAQLPSEGRMLRLVRSRDGVTYEQVAKLDVDRPSETTLRFAPDGTMVAMIRRVADPATGWIGTAKPPYTDWKFAVSNKLYGGPNFVQLPNGAWLAASRGYESKGRTTELWWLDLDDATFRHQLTFPSGGDTSYAGFVVDEAKNRLFVSYYSSHEGKAAIYLVTLRLDALMAKQP